MAAFFVWGSVSLRFYFWLPIKLTLCIIKKLGKRNKFETIPDFLGYWISRGTKDVARIKGEVKNLNRTSLSRRYDIDWLRNIGILLLFPFHSARIFDHWEAFYTKSDQLSWVLSWFVALTDYWFMPLLFWLAGSSSWYALETRSASAYARDRYSRLLIPFVFGLLLVVPPQGYYAQLPNGGEANYWMYLPKFFTDFHDLSGYTGGFSPTHLWFILYLFVISLVSLPLLTRWKQPRSSTALNRYAALFSKPIPYLLLSVLLTLVQTLPAPGGKNPIFYLCIFVFGFLAVSRPVYQEKINAYKGWALLLSGVLVPLWAVLGTWGYGEHMGVAWLENVNLLLAMVVIMGYGNKYLNRSHQWLAYLNEAAFPVYILHQTVLVVISYYVLPLSIGLYGEFLLTMIGTLVVSLLLYEWIIKRTSLTRWMFGVKGRNRDQKSQFSG